MNKKIKRVQDNVGYYSIADGDESDLLMQADEGKIVLFAALPRHSAILVNGFGLNRAIKGQRIIDNCLVPMMPRDAGMLISYPQATISKYFAVHPDTPESHPWHDHYFVLNEPQQITRDQVYFQAEAEAEQAKQVDAPPVIARKGIKKQEAIDAFGGLVKTNLSKALSDSRPWISEARLSRGTQGGKHISMWCPVLLAICLHEHLRVPKAKLNQAFFNHDFLAPWRDEWHETSKDLA